jgi:hypothetical protein
LRKCNRINRGRVPQERMMADLHNYNTGEYIREATDEECEASVKAAESDGGAGVIVVDGVSCYVED